MTAGSEVEFVNQQILDYTGKILEELRDWRPLVRPDDPALVMKRWMHSIKTGDAYEIEHRILGKVKVSGFAAPAWLAWKLAAFVGALPAQSRRRA